MNKKIAVLGMALVLISGLVVAAGQVSAYGFGQGDHQTMISRFAQAFGKSEEEVKVVFDQIHQERQTQMQVEFEARLDAAVAAGTITAEQKQLIIAKHEELKVERESFRENEGSLTREEIRTSHLEQREELEQWAIDNGLDLSVWFELGKGGRKGMGGRMMRGDATVE